MKTKLLIFKFDENNNDFDYDDFRFYVTHGFPMSIGAKELIYGVFQISCADFTEVYSFITQHLNEYKDNIQSVYVMDGNLSSDAKDLIG
jgi:hypothetical protein